MGKRKGTISEEELLESVNTDSTDVLTPAEENQNQETAEATDTTTVDAQPQNQDTIVNPEIDRDLEQQLLAIDDNILQKSKTSKSVSKEQVKKILERIQVYKGGIPLSYIMFGVTTLLRRGAANAGAANTIKVEINIPGKEKPVAILRYDIVMAMTQIVGHSNVRKLAEAMSPEMISVNLLKIKTNPFVDLKGDLANRINRKLFIRKEPALTREEEVCCCTYAQWMPNLNELAGSTRLKSLLEEDLNARRKKQDKRQNKKGKRNNKN